MREIRSVAIEQAESMIAMDMGEQYAPDLVRCYSGLMQCRSRVTIFGSPRGTSAGIDENNAVGVPQGKTVYIHLKRQLTPCFDDAMPCDVAIRMDQHVRWRFKHAVAQKDNLISPEVAGTVCH